MSPRQKPGCRPGYIPHVECRTIVLPWPTVEDISTSLLAASNGKHHRHARPVSRPCDAGWHLRNGNRIRKMAASAACRKFTDKGIHSKTTTFGTGGRYAMPWNGTSVSSSDLEERHRTMPVWECCSGQVPFFDKEGHEVRLMEKASPMRCLLSEISSIDSSSAHPTLKGMFHGGVECAILSSVPMEPTYSLQKTGGYGEGTGYCYAASFRTSYSTGKNVSLASRCRCGRRL